MKPIFTVHKGELLVGDHVNRRLGKKYDVRLSVKESGVDVLVTDRKRQQRPAGLQVKFSRSFRDPLDDPGRFLARGWYTLDPAKIRESPADLRVFVVLTPREDGT